MDSLPYSTEYKPVAIHSVAQNRPNGMPWSDRLQYHNKGIPQ